MDHPRSGPGSPDPFKNFTPHVMYTQRLTLETSIFVHWSATRSLSLVMSQYFLRGRGQCHVSNFYIVYLENFASVSRWYTGDIHNSVRSRFVYDTYRTMEAIRSRHG